MTTSIGTSTNQRIDYSTWASTTSIPHLLIASSQAKASLGRTQSAPKGQRDADSSICKLWQQWTIVSLLFNSSSSMYPRGSLYSTQRGNGGSNPSNLEAYGRPRVKWFRNTSRKTPKIFGLMHTSQCTWV